MYLKSCNKHFNVVRVLVLSLILRKWCNIMPDFIEIFLNEYYFPVIFINFYEYHKGITLTRDGMFPISFNVTLTIENTTG